MKSDQNPPANERATPDAEHLHAAVTHLGESIDSGHIASSAAKGILYSLVETLGVLVGDPDTLLVPPADGTQPLPEDPELVPLDVVVDALAALWSPGG